MLSVLRLAPPSQAQVSSMVFSQEKSSSAIRSHQEAEQMADGLGWPDIEDMGIEKNGEISSNSAVTFEKVQTPSRSNAHLLELASPDTFLANEPDLVESKSAEQASPSEDPNAGLRIPTNLGEGLPIERVFIYLRNPTGDPEQDQAFQQQIADTFRIRAGGSFSTLFAAQGLNEVQQLPLVLMNQRVRLPGESFI